MPVTSKILESAGNGAVALTLAGFAVPALSAKHTNSRAISSWNTGTMQPKQSTLMRDGINAIETYIAAKCGSPVRNCALLRISENEVSAEYQNTDSNTVDIVYYCAENGVLNASRKTPTGAIEQLKTLGRNSQEKVAALLFAMIPVLIENNPEFEDDIRVLTNWYPTCKQTNGVVVFTDAAEFALRRVCDAFYYGIINGRVVVSSIDQFGNVPKLDQVKLDAHSYDGVVLLGEPTILSETSSAATDHAEKVTVAMAKRTFEVQRKASLDSLTPEQLAEVPNVDDDIVVPKWVFKFIRAFYDTKGTKIPFVNFRVEGGTGVGKSFGVRIMAHIMGKPMKSMNLNPDTDKIDLKDQIIPNAESDTVSRGFAIRRPDFNDLLNDPVSFYQDVTGIEKLDVTPAECQEAYDRAAATTGSQFRHILSPIMEGLQGPYIVEIQEMSRARPAVLSGLNEMYDRGGVIHLEGAGKQFTRHPESIIVSTDNYDYPGCKPLSPDNRRRFNLKLRIPSLSEEQAVAMAAQQTGFNDNDALTRMWKIIKEVANYCEEQHIKDGDVGLSELIDWAVMVKLGRGKYESFVDCVVNSTTGNDKTEQELKDYIIGTAAVGRFFDEEEV